MNLQGQQTQKGTLNCSVRLDHYTSGEIELDWFTVEALQSELDRKEYEHDLLRVQIDDVSDGFVQSKPILVKGADGNSEQNAVFSCESSLADILKNPTLSDQVPVARIECNQLLFPHSGHRSLRFQVYLLSGPHHEVSASGYYIIDYHNADSGYIDIKQNHYTSKTLGLALAINAVDRNHRLNNRQLGLLRGWVLSGLDLDAIGMKSKKKFEKSFQGLVTIIRNDGLSELEPMCRELDRIAPSAVRYDILSLALELMAHTHSVQDEYLRQLLNMAQWLSLDIDRFRAMLSKLLPVHEQKEVDLKILLGITSDMDQEQTLKQLHQEYAKWNSRITNPNKNIREQADHMLEQIAEMYNQQLREAKADSESESGLLTSVGGDKDSSS